MIGIDPIKGLIVGIISSIPLGPIGVLVIQKTLSKGRWSGLVSGLGASFSDTIYAIIAGFSLSYVIDFVRAQQSYIQFIGGLILMFFGISLVRVNPVKELRQQFQNKKKTKLLQDFITSFIITLSNPLIIFMLLGIFAGLNIFSDPNVVKNSVIILGFFCGSVIWWFTLSTVVNLFRNKINLRRLIVINRVTGIMILILAFASASSAVYAWLTGSAFSFF